jgi:hypothetical protein
MVVMLGFRVDADEFIRRNGGIAIVIPWWAHTIVQPAESVSQS